MGRSYYLYPNKKGIYLAEILNPQTGERICTRNTGAKSRDDALLLAADWVKNGIPDRKRGRVSIYKKPKTLSTEATTGLADVLPKVRNLLLSLLDKSPHKDIEPAKQFIFWSADAEKPTHGQIIQAVICDKLLR